MTIDKNLTTQVYQRDGYKCRHCFDRNGLHPHHIKFKSQSGPDELWNLITVCWQCHRAIHDGFLLLTGSDANGIITFQRKKGWRPK